MKIILINPPREVLQVPDYPPLGLAYISAAIIKDGHEVEILDAASWRWNKLKKEIKLREPDIIGITCWTIERGQAYKTGKISRKLFPSVIIIYGGPHATAFPEHMFKMGKADYVVMGEGEETIVELLSSIKNENELCGIQGIAYKNKEEKIIINDRRQLINNLDGIAQINHDQFDYDLYNGLSDNKRKAAAIMTSRGCPFKCIYCSSSSYWGKKYRTRSIKSVIEEIEHLYYVHSIRAFIIFDDNLLIARSRCIELCNEIINKQLDIEWVAEGTVKVDREMLEVMKKAGCYRIDFGVESGSQKILNNIKKPYTVEKTKEAFRLCKEVGIQPVAYMIFGSPGETYETIDETIEVMKEISPNSGGGRPGLWILPNTELYEKSKEQRVIDDETWLKTNKTIYYTGEYSEKELSNLVRRYSMGMHKGRNYKKYYILKFMGLMPYSIEKIIRYNYDKIRLLLK
jgi:anaerobic magnesium-protoporphyrin IX monomethyl ester cyclase